ncbi:putative cytochrome P450 4V3 [Rosellinia necatrix]|uniref:Putative cytochrome P450 4V3 n=1 Tax=Rosellinia necatrix TaxID=77044 RepID=A0A1S7UNK8_ROSNE|nr:putative cytochrome P450 4V3 [Rosellinia necatrix]
MGANTTNPILIRAVGAVIALFVARFLYRGYVQRSRVRALKAQGIPVLPHSALFGHLRVLGDWRAENPADANFYSFHTWLIKNCRRYFPDLDFPPPVVYLDLWPVEMPLAMVYDPVAASQFAQAPSLPKLALAKDFLVPLTSGLDIVSNEGAEWKTWRSRFNPGFSQRNLMAMLPELIEEVSIFIAQLEGLAGGGGKWGPVFQLEEKTTNLTFDIICRAAVGMRLNEQIRPESGPLKLALLDQIRLMSLGANAARALPLGRMPWHNAAARRNNKVLRDLLMPQIQNKLHTDTNESQVKTIVDLAIKYIDKDDPNATREKPNAAFVDRLIANLKAFLFAGHDTTAATICFMIKLLQDNPECLAKLRAEHDAVLGPDPSRAADVLSESPHLLYLLPYTLGAIKETLRLNPLAATLREAPAGFSLTAPGSSIRYPVGGWGVWLSAPGVARNPSYWPRPDEFLPERWMVPEGDPLHPVNNSAWAPFSIGPRNCIGMELALIELRIVSVLVARRFDIEEAWDDWDMQKQTKATPHAKIDGQRLYSAGDGIVHPKDGMPVHVRLREHVPAV